MSEQTASPRYLYYRGEKPLYLLSAQIPKGSETFIELTDSQVAEIEQDRLGRFLIRDGELFHRDRVPDSKKRVLMINDWGTNCGIATYSEYLANGLRPLVGQLRILAEDAPGAVGPEVVACWKRSGPGNPGDYTRILPEVQLFEPDLIIIQHEFGLFHRQDAWLALLSQLSRWRTVTVLHTVLDHEVSNRDARLDYTTRCLSEVACREVIVHCARARHTLRARGFGGRVHVIPHGCHAPEYDNRLPSTKYGLYPMYTVFQYGFGGRHKGWGLALDIIDKLREKYPDVFYLGSMNVSELDRGDTEDFHRSLLDQVVKRGLQKNVSLLLGYQTEQMIGQLIKCSRVALFPYQVPNPHWASWGASGAIQQPLSLGIPTVLSDFPAFQEFEDHLPICHTLDDYVGVIDRIFSEPEYEKQLGAQAHLISELRRWDRTAARFLECKRDSDYNAEAFPEVKEL